MLSCITYDGRVIFMLMNVNAGMPAEEKITDNHIKCYDSKP